METRGANEASSKRQLETGKITAADDWIDLWSWYWWGHLSDNLYVHIIYPTIQKYCTFPITWQKSIECLHDWLKTPFAASEPSQGGNCKSAPVCVIPRPDRSIDWNKCILGPGSHRAQRKAQNEAIQLWIAAGIWSDGMFALLCTLLTPAGVDGRLAGWMMGRSGPGTVPQLMEERRGPCTMICIIIVICTF